MSKIQKSLFLVVIFAATGAITSTTALADAPEYTPADTVSNNLKIPEYQAPQKAFSLKKAVTSQPTLLAAECNAICKYKDSAGNVYLGLSSGDCDSACGKASDKCSSDSSSGGCSKVSCSATDC